MSYALKTKHLRPFSPSLLPPIFSPANSNCRVLPTLASHHPTSPCLVAHSSIALPMPSSSDSLLLCE